MEDDENVGQKNGFFKTYHVKVLEKLVDSDLKQFSRCSTDEQKFVFCHRLPYIHQHQPPQLKPLFKAKSSLLSTQERVEGNKAFAVKDYQRALLLYSSAVLKAPQYNGT